MPIRFTQRIGRSVGFCITQIPDESVLQASLPLLNRDARLSQLLAHTLKFGYCNPRGHLI
jgi:hypothetical protein